MPSPLLVDHHVQSLDGLEERLRSALADLFPLLSGSDPIELEDVTLGPGVWKHTADRPTWLRPLYYTLKTEHGTVSRAIADLPWPCDTNARGELDALREDALLDIELGAHDGLFVDRPLVGLGQWLPAPGMHLVYRLNSRGQKTTRATIVPDAGNPLYVDREEDSNKITLVTGAGRISRPLEDLVASDDSKGSPRTLRRFRQLLGIEPAGIPVAWFSPTTSEQIKQATGLPLVDGALTPAHADWLVERLSGTEAPEIGETWEAATDLRLFGDLYLDAVWSATRSAIAGFLGANGTSARARILLDRIRRKADGQVRKILSGSGSGTPLAIGEDTTNTLARLESRRKFTRFGPRGSRRPQRGLDHHRDLPSDYRGILCPISTPESEDIGLVRFLASGAHLGDDGSIIGPSEAGGMGDFSTAGTLVPFVNHNDPVRASIGSRILRQAVVLANPEPPLVRTGGERAVAEAMGVCRSLVRGRIDKVGRDSIDVVDVRGRRVAHPFGPATSGGEGVPQRWQVVSNPGDRVNSGDILAHAPDVAVEDGVARLAIGINCVVAYMPWRGLNYEDAIVVSESLAERLTSVEEIVIREELTAADIVAQKVNDGRPVEAGDVIAGVFNTEHIREITSPVTGVIGQIAESAEQLEIRVLAHRPLAVGDKLTNRYGAKGVVSTITPDAEMPQMADGTRVELIANPLGVLRRLNIGQFLETHVGLLSKLTGKTPARAGRTFEDLEALREGLAAAGASNGRVALAHGNGSRALTSDVVAGIQYFVKLDHMAADKAQVRSSGRRSVRSHQPMPGSRWAGGLKTGGPQRLGEMEFWCLQALGADRLVDDALSLRSDEPVGQAGTSVGATLLSANAHLLAAGFRLVFEYEDGTEVDGQLDGLDHLDRSRLRSDRVGRVVEAALEPLQVDETPEGSDAADDPLYDDQHGGFDATATCPCGLETRRGRFCKACREVAMALPTPDRRTLKFGIVLAEPVPHPWFKEGSDLILSEEMSVLPILPPEYRTQGRDPLDRRYRWVAVTNRRLTDALERGVGVPHARRALRKAIVDVVGRPGDDPDRQTIAARLGGKFGLLRRHLLGRTTDLSGRGVIIPDPLMDAEHVGLPDWMFNELGLAIPTGSNGSGEQYDDVCLLNRQPSLHPYSIVALRARPVPGDAIRIHPVLCGAIAGDFDGDTVAIHRPAESEAQEEAWDTARPSRRLRTAASGALLANMDLDNALGLHLATTTIDGRHRVASVSGIAVGDEPLTGSTLPAYVDDTVRSVNDRRGQLRKLEELMSVGFDSATGWSVSLLETDAVPSQTADEMDLEGLRREVDFRVAQSASLTQAVEAGVAGKPDVRTQLLGDREPTAGFDPNLLGTKTDPGNLLTGLSDNRYFQCVNGAMRTLADKKLTTPPAGALTKSLVEAAYDVAVSEEDCGQTGERSPLTCFNAESCARCYGNDLATDEPPPVGARIGILAAQLIGERGTQLAMKVFHGGGTGIAVGGRVQQLKGLFGAGPFVMNDQIVRLNEVFAASSSLEESGPRLLAVFTDLVGNDVDPVHAAVIFRRLWETSRTSAWPSLLSGAAATGSPLVDATVRGNLNEIVTSGTHSGPSRVTTAKLRLIVGGSEQ